MDILKNSASDRENKIAPCEAIHGSQFQYEWCVLDAERKVLMQANFEYMDLVDLKDTQLIKTATDWDDHSISFDDLSNKEKYINNMFLGAVRERDALRKQKFINGMNAIAAGLNSVPQYQPTYAPIPTASFASPPPIDNISGPMLNSLSNNYVREDTQPQQLSPIDKLRTCGANGTCEGVFAPGN